MKEIRPAIVLVLLFALLTGLVFPLAITGLAQVLMPHQANGSLAVLNGKVVGSELIGQPFASPRNFHPRPSAAGSGYDAANSGGSNLGPTSKKLIDDVRGFAAAYRKENGLAADALLPPDAATRSGSGLDPHISVANALLQVPRVAQVRHVDADKVRKMVEESIEKPFLGVYGEPAVNVLKLNLALERGD